MHPPAAQAIQLMARHTYIDRKTTHPAKRDPRDMETLFGIICSPTSRNQNQSPITHRFQYCSPATDALVSATVSNHKGKKYWIAKLASETRKLLQPTRTGTFCSNKCGANTGSGASRSSTYKNARMNVPDTARGVITDAADHYALLERKEQGE